jgi:hypothetical protein
LMIISLGRPMENSELTIIVGLAPSAKQGSI